MQVFWSVKGGSGTTVVAAATALCLASEGSRGVLVLDLAGDLPAVLGADGSGPGVADWCAATDGAGPEALDRLAVEVAEGLRVVPRGAAGWAGADPGRVADLVDHLGGLDGGGETVVVDAGDLFSLVPPVGPPTSLVGSLAEGADRSVLVTRACYLGLRRVGRVDLRPSEVALVSEAGRALDRHDVESVVGAPVTVRIPVDPAVARSVDAGLLARRTPRSLLRAVAAAA